jgi:hypothetical protein
MKKLTITLLLCTICQAQDAKLVSLASLVTESIIKMDSSSFTKCLSNEYFDYFEGDLEADPKTVDSNYYKLLPTGYYGKELSQLINNKDNIIKLFTTESNTHPRNKCPLSDKSFSPLNKISNNRYEIIIMRFADVYKMHLVFIKFKTGWKLAGSFFEAANTDPCEKWNGNIWENNN